MDHRNDLNESGSQDTHGASASAVEVVDPNNAPPQATTQPAFHVQTCPVDPQPTGQVKVPTRDEFYEEAKRNGRHQTFRGWTMHHLRTIKNRKPMSPQRKLKRKLIKNAKSATIVGCALTILALIMAGVLLGANAGDELLKVSPQTSAN